MSAEPAPDSPISELEHAWGTFGCSRQVLMVARTLTSTIRLLEAAELFRDDFRINIVFTVNDTSQFSHGAHELLHAAGVDNVVPWQEIVEGGVSYSLAISASENIDFSPITSRTVVLPHGIGFNKYVPDAGGEGTRLAGLPPVDALRSGRVRLVLAHPEQEAQLRAVRPEIAENTAVTGDPTYDDLSASLPLRGRYRRVLGTGERTLIFLTSTWRPESQMGRWCGLPEQLLAELPADEYQVVAALHPNIWAWYSRHQVHTWLASALDAGLLLLPPERGWQAALVAADQVIGDHGSLTLYAAALGKPLLLSALADETVAGTPVAELASRTGRLDPARGLREQLEPGAVGPENRRIPFHERVFSNVGDSKRVLRDVLYAELGLSPRRTTPALRSPAEPEPERRAVTSFDVLTEFTAATTIEISRFPRAARSREPTPAREATSATRHLAVDEAETDLRLPQNASVLVRREIAAPGEATTWTREKLADFPGARLAASATVDGCVAELRDGTVVEVTASGTDPALLASAIYACFLAGRISSGELTLRTGTTETNSVLKILL